MDKRQHGSGYTQFKAYASRVLPAPDYSRCLMHPSPADVAAAMVQDDRNNALRQHIYMIVPDERSALQMTKDPQSVYVAIVEDDMAKVRAIAREVHDTRGNTQGLFFLKPDGRSVRFRATSDAKAKPGQQHDLFH